MSRPTNPVALVTGSGRRIGAAIVTQLHQCGYNLVVHYRNARVEALSLVSQCNRERPDSAIAVAADLTNPDDLLQLAQQAVQPWQRLDVLVNNASSYYPTPLGTVDVAQWRELMATNAQAPFFLAQHLAPALRRQQGCIVNIGDIHAERPLLDYVPYTVAKAANAMLTKALARELAPQIRVNGVAPGVILWPENAAEHAEAEKERIMAQVPLGRPGDADDIARTVVFLASDAPYITGQIIAVDGGRSLFL